MFKIKIIFIILCACLLGCDEKHPKFIGKTRNEILEICAKTKNNYVYEHNVKVPAFHLAYRKKRGGIDNKYYASVKKAKEDIVLMKMKNWHIKFHEGYTIYTYFYVINFKDNIVISQKLGRYSDI